MQGNWAKTFFFHIVHKSCMNTSPERIRLCAKTRKAREIKLKRNTNIFFCWIGFFLMGVCVYVPSHQAEIFFFIHNFWFSVFWFFFFGDKKKRLEWRCTKTKGRLFICPQKELNHSMIASFQPVRVFFFLKKNKKKIWYPIFCVFFFALLHPPQKLCKCFFVFAFYFCIFATFFSWTTHPEKKAVENFFWAKKKKNRYCCDPFISPQIQASPLIRTIYFFRKLQK